MEGQESSRADEWPINFCRPIARAGAEQSSHFVDACGPGRCLLGYGVRPVRQRSEQYLTSPQTFSHFLRHVKGRPHVAQIFAGRSDFFGFLGGRMRGYDTMC